MSDTLNILYVEDSEDDLDLMELSLMRHGVDINMQSAETIFEAIEKFSVHDFDAALLDWNLSDGQGTEVAQHIRSTHNALPIIFLSSAFAAAHITEASQYNPKACLTKSYSKDHILKIIDLIQ